MGKRKDLENPRKAFFRILPLFLMTVVLGMAVKYLPHPKNVSKMAGEPLAVGYNEGYGLFFPFHIRFEGAIGQPETQKVDLVVKNKLKNTEKKYNDVLVTAGKNGLFSGAVTLSGINSSEGLEFIVKGPMHLARKFFPDEDFSLKPLIPGDLPNPNYRNRQDGQADSLDFSLVKSRIGETDKESLSIADVNFDLVINELDLELVSQAVKERLKDEN